MNLVTIASYTWVHEAHLAKALLEDHGITCFIADDNIVSVDPLASIAYGGVKVRVPEDEIDTALTILRSVASSQNKSEEIIEASLDQERSWPGLAVFFGSLAFFFGFLILLREPRSVKVWALVLVGALIWGAGWYERRRSRK